MKKKAIVFFYHFGFPQERSYGMFRAGDVLFVMLDTAEDKERDPLRARYTRYTFNSTIIEKQREWLHQAVKNEEFKTAKFRIVLAYAPSQGNDNAYTDRLAPTERRNVTPLSFFRNAEGRFLPQSANPHSGLFFYK